jgi:hypothetical protein
VIARQADGLSSERHRLQPHCLVIKPPRAELLAFPTDGTPADALLIDIERIEEVTTTDATFSRPDVDVAAILEKFTAR